MRHLSIANKNASYLPFRYEAVEHALWLDCQTTGSDPALDQGIGSLCGTGSMANLVFPLRGQLGQCRVLIEHVEQRIIAKSIGTAGCKFDQPRQYTLDDLRLIARLSKRDRTHKAGHTGVQRYPLQLF